MSKYELLISDVENDLVGKVEGQKVICFEKTGPTYSYPSVRGYTHNGVRPSRIKVDLEAYKHPHHAVHELLNQVGPMLTGLGSRARGLRGLSEEPSILIMDDPIRDHEGTEIGREKVKAVHDFWMKANLTEGDKMKEREIKGDKIVETRHTLEVLNEREETHGDFSEVAEVAQALKKVISDADNKRDRTYRMNEALDMFCTKVARIVCGQATTKDHWDDIAGYSTLVSESL